MSRHPVRIQIRRSESGQPDKGAQVTYMTHEEVQRLRQTGYEPDEIVYAETRPCPILPRAKAPSRLQRVVWRAMDYQGLLDPDIGPDEMDDRITAYLIAHDYEVPKSLRDIWQKLLRADRKRQREQ
jgi:hypothetical protein